MNIEFVILYIMIVFIPYQLPIHIYQIYTHTHTPTHTHTHTYIHTYTHTHTHTHTYIYTHIYRLSNDYIVHY